MDIKDFISHASSLNDRSSLLHYLKDNITKIEYSFYNSSFKELEALKFDIDDYCYDLIPLLEKTAINFLFTSFILWTSEFKIPFLFEIFE